jgi:hypothetical protein
MSKGNFIQTIMNACFKLSRLSVVKLNHLKTLNDYQT